MDKVNHPISDAEVCRLTQQLRDLTTARAKLVRPARVVVTALNMYEDMLSKRLADHNEACINAATALAEMVGEPFAQLCYHLY